MTTIEAINNRVRGAMSSHHSSRRGRSAAHRARLDAPGPDREGTFPSADAARLCYGQPAGSPEHDRRSRYYVYRRQGKRVGDLPWGGAVRFRPKRLPAPSRGADRRGSAS